MEIFDGSKDYGTNEILIHYTGNFNESTVVKWIVRNYPISKWGKIVDHTPPQDTNHGWNCGRIVWK